MKRSTRHILIISVSFIVVGVSVAGFGFWRLNHHSPIPTAIKKQLSFITLLPNTDSQAILQKDSFKYDQSNKVLTYKVSLERGQLATVSEQTTPDVFNDFPDYYDKLTEHMNEYDSFNSRQGKVALTRPINTTGQTAAINSPGTLLFIHAEKDVTKEQWQKLINNLEVSH